MKYRCRQRHCPTGENGLFGHDHIHHLALIWLKVNFLSEIISTNSHGICEAPNLGPFLHDITASYSRKFQHSLFPRCAGLVAIIYRNYIKKSEFRKVDSPGFA